MEVDFSMAPHDYTILGDGPATPPGLLGKLPWGHPDLILGLAHLLASAWLALGVLAAVEMAGGWSSVRGHHGKQTLFWSYTVTADIYICSSTSSGPLLSLARGSRGLLWGWVMLLLLTVYLFYVCQPNICELGDRWAAAIPNDSAANLV